jgi:hypothetical protein
MQRHARTPILARTIFVFALIAPCAVVHAATANAAEGDLCPDQYAALQTTQDKIAEHNAKPSTFTIPGEEAALDAYNAEATGLTAAQDTAYANLRQCLQAMETLTSGDPNSTAARPPSDKVTASIAAAAKKVPATWKPASAPDADGTWHIAGDNPIRPLYDELRSGGPGKYGDTALHGTKRPSAGDRDPAYPKSSGIVIEKSATGDPRVLPCYIVPLAEIVNMRDFTKLNAANMYIVTHAPVNLQWLSEKALLSTFSRSVASMSGVDGTWQASQTAMENDVRRQLRGIIDALVKSQGA